MQLKQDGKQLGRRPLAAMSVGRTCRLQSIERQARAPLQAANGTPISTYGIRDVELCFGDQRFSWDFITAKVTIPLLGADFLCAYGLLVDIKGHRLIDAVTLWGSPALYQLRMSSTAS